MTGGSDYPTEQVARRQGFCVDCAMGAHPHDKWTRAAPEVRRRERQVGEDAGCPNKGCECDYVIPLPTRDPAQWVSVPRWAVVEQNNGWLVARAALDAATPELLGELEATKALLAATREMQGRTIADFCALRDALPREQVEQILGSVRERDQPCDDCGLDETCMCGEPRRDL